MIQKFIISNFYSIRDSLEVSFEASKEKYYQDDWTINIGGHRLLKALFLYGANGSGKTNILCAFDVLRSLVLMLPKSIDDDFRFMPFMLDHEAKQKPTSFDLYFYIGETRYRYFVEIQTDKILYEELCYYHSGNKFKTAFTRKYDTEKSVNTIRFGSWLALSVNDKREIVKSTNNNISVLSAYASKNISCPFLTIVRNYFRDKFFRFYSVEEGDGEVAKAIKSDPNLKPLLLDFIKHFNSNIIDIQVFEESMPISEEAKQILMQMQAITDIQSRINDLRCIKKFTVQYIHKTQLGVFPLDGNLQSEGTRNFIRHLVLFYQGVQNNWQIVLDEFGNGLQARTQHLIVDFFLKFSSNAQLLVATQSLGLLDFPHMRRDAILIISKDSIGQTHLDAKTVRTIHRNIKLRKAYLDGKFTTINPMEPETNVMDYYAKYSNLIFNLKREEVKEKDKDEV